MSDYYGNSLSDFTVDQRVSIHPTTDLFMMGDVFGTVTLIGRKYVSVKFDRSQKVRRILPDLLTPTDAPEGYEGVSLHFPGMPPIKGVGHAVTAREMPPLEEIQLYDNDTPDDPAVMGLTEPTIATVTPHDSAVFETPKADPRNVARWANFHRINNANEAHQAWVTRVATVRKRGYTGPILRSDLSR